MPVTLGLLLAAACLLAGPPCTAVDATFVSARPLQSSRRPLQSSRDAAAAAAVPEAEASAGDSDEAPPHWIRLVTSAGCAEHADQVAAAVAEVSENLPVRRARVRSFQRGGAEVGEAEEWLLSVAVPPKATLLVSSMIGEALAALPGDRLPMVLASGLDFEGEAEYFVGELPAAALPVGPEPEAAMAELGQRAVEQRLAACAQVDGAAGTLLFRTTAEGRRGLERWLPTQGVADAAAAWTAVGGNAEYLQWVGGETGPEGEGQAA